MNYNIKYIFGEKSSFYKANLHSRSSLSDGSLSPEELKNIYKENGYSVLAITDNEPICQKTLSDKDFLILSGFDFGTKSREGKIKKSCALTAISLNEEPFPVDKFDAVYGSDGVNAYLCKYKENGYFITYNHPIRSLETMPDFLGYEPIDAMEIMNYSSICEGYDEYNGFSYDLFNRYGKKIYCVATDGNRNQRPLDDPRSDSFGAFTVINSDSLDYKSVSEALVNGKFYSSEAPEINAIWIKGDSLNVRCSAADRIVLLAGRRAVRCFYKNENAPLTAATFKISPDDVYIRIMVIDEKGRKAYTNAYYTDDLLS